MRVTPVLVLVSVIAGSAAGCSKNAQQYLQSGNTYVGQQKYLEAVVEYRNAIQKDPRSGEARYRLAETYEQLGDSESAFREYVRAADLLPANKEAQLKAGASLLMAAAQGDPSLFEDAKRRAQNVLTLDPRNLEAQVLLANATAGMDDLDGAIREIQEAIQLDPKASRTYANLGALQFAKGNAEEAEKAFRRAVDIEPASVSAHLALANFLWNTGRQEDAEALFVQARALEPSNVQANRALATFFLASNRAPQAEPFLMSIAETTKDTGAAMALADYYAETRRAGDAVKLLEGVATKQGAFAEARTRIAAIQYAEGHPAEAHKTIDEVLAREPDNGPALLVKARFLLRENQLDAALARATTAVRSDPESAAAQVHAWQYPGVETRHRRCRQGIPGSPQAQPSRGGSAVAAGTTAAGDRGDPAGVGICRRSREQRT